MGPGETAQSSEQEILWTADQESALFHSMQGHRPVGVAKHFHVACIAHSFSNTIGITVSPNQIWKHLRSMYDLETLDEREDLPFPNDETNFSLPPEFFDDTAEEEEEDKDEKLASETSSLTLSEKKTSSGRRATPEPPTPTPPSAGTKRKRTRVSAAAASAAGSSPPSPSTPAPPAKRRRT
ncbi:MRG/MORF4L-binding protein-like [Sycon ciliatum]|uniref:MRG/MORF4L-binding protein-like n=1 Tax=Sycon ciliatum TaxID=27933 RepID=UPI0020ADC11A|eukprot:scpid100517/ scgid13219/ MRG-binding protein